MVPQGICAGFFDWSSGAYYTFLDAIFEGLSAENLLHLFLMFTIVGSERYARSRFNHHHLTLLRAQPKPDPPGRISAQACFHSLYECTTACKVLARGELPMVSELREIADRVHVYSTAPEMDKT